MDAGRRKRSDEKIVNEDPVWAVYIDTGKSSLQRDWRGSTGNMMTTRQDTMCHYYARRASEYERVDSKPERQSEMRRIEGCYDRQCLF